MAWNQSDELIVAGTGEVYVAAVGTSLPANESTALSSSLWTGLGYHTEDGVSISNTPETQRYNAWQSKRPVRLDRGVETFTLTFNLEQFNEATFPLAFGGGDVTEPTSGHYKYEPPTDTDGLDERAVICDVVDGANIIRFVIPRGVATEAVETSFTRTALATLPITIEALEPADGGSAWYALSNLAGFEVGS